jgi:hypothetical protein
MEKQEKSQPRESLDDKPSLLEERPKSEEHKDNFETDPHQNGDTPTKNESPEDSPPAETEWEYVTGLKLVLAIIAVTLAAFLMLLDNSIIATVSTQSIARALLNSHHRPFRGSQLTSNLSTTSVGMEVPTSSLGEFCFLLLSGKDADTLERSCALQPLAGKIYHQFSTKVRHSSYLQLASFPC